MTITDMIGYLAVLLSTVCFLPQAIKTLRHRATRDLSLTGLILLLANVSCWLIYGLLNKDMPLILANLVTVTMIAATLGAKIHYERGAA
ncbi:SemiSWEET family sugar transporter [Paracoccus sp. p4-l81]|uniref:SemiSWEET family sugar transporter n=1 Tax=unclassified Paracoccus (in: a-proteobacteria) TaxID=2688777 RepID=UPI0035B8EC20